MSSVGVFGARGRLTDRSVSLGGHGHGSEVGEQDVAGEAARARDVQAGDGKAKLATAASKESTEKVVLRGTWRRGKGYKLWQDKF